MITQKDTDFETLSKRELLFCLEYCKDYNSTRAAIAAGYSVKTSYSIANRLLKKPAIISKIDSLFSDIKRTCMISVVGIIEQHKKIAFSSIANLHNTWIERKEFEQLTEDQKSCIQEISTKVLKVKTDSGPIADVEYVKIKLYDKQKSLDSLATILGFNAPVKTEITGKDGHELFPNKLDLSALTDTELITLHNLILKARPKDSSPI